MARIADWHVIAVFSSLTLLLYLTWSVQRPYVPLFAKEELDATIVEVGLIASTPPIVAALLGVPLGLTVDIVGKRRMLATGATLIGLSVFLVSTTTNPIQVILIYSLMGVGWAAFDPAMSAYVSVASRGINVGKFFGVYTMVIQSSNSIGPAIGGFLLSYLSYRNLFVVFGLVGILSATLSSILPYHSVMSITAKNLATNFSELRKNKTEVTGWLITVFSFATFGGLVPFLPLFAKSLHYDNLTVGLLLASIASFSAISRLPIGLLSDRKGKLTEIGLLGLLLQAVSIAVMPVAADLLSLFILTSVFGTSVAMTNLSGHILTAKGASRENQGLAMGFASTFRWIGFAIGPLISAYSSDYFESIVGGFYALTFFAFFGILVILLATQKTKVHNLLRHIRKDSYAQ